MGLSVFSDEHFMKQALLEAQKAFDEGEVPVGAVVVCENRIIAKDHNRSEQLNDATAHAEMLALTAAQNHLGSKYLNECRLYVTLEPCVMCAGALSWTQVAKIIWGANDPDRGYRKFNESIPHPKTEITTGILETESAQLIRDFFSKIRK